MSTIDANVVDCASIMFILVLVVLLIGTVFSILSLLAGYAISKISFKSHNNEKTL